jgi:hypothetical protein
MSMVASLNETLEELKKAKYDATLERGLREWMAARLNDPSIVSAPNLPAILKDGTILCKYGFILFQNELIHLNHGDLI